jgi:hypothetical protein
VTKFFFGLKFFPIPALVFFLKKGVRKDVKLKKERRKNMKKVFAFMLLSFLVGGCNGQKKQNEKETKQTAIADTTVQPKTDIRVNKKYDDKGNLIQYDSSYSYFYSSPGFKNSINSDSLFSNFKIPLRNDYRSLLDENMNSIFFNDTLFKYDFYNSDYFSKRFQLNMLRFENMFREMDSLKLNRFKEAYPSGEIRRRKENDEGNK